MERHSIVASTVSQTSILLLVITAVLLINCMFGWKLSVPSLVFQYCDIQKDWQLKESDVAT